MPGLPEDYFKEVGELTLDQVNKAINRYADLNKLGVAQDRHAETRRIQIGSGRKKQGVKGMDA